MKTMRALIVVPDAARRIALAKLLDECCFECVEAGDGISAMQLGSDDAIDLIVVDFPVTGMDRQMFLDLVISGAFGRKAPPLIVCSAEPHELWGVQFAPTGIALLPTQYTPRAFAVALDAAFPAD